MQHIGQTPTTFTCQYYRDEKYMILRTDARDVGEYLESIGAAYSRILNGYIIASKDAVVDLYRLHHTSISAADALRERAKKSNTRTPKATCSTTSADATYMCVAGGRLVVHGELPDDAAISARAQPYKGAARTWIFDCADRAALAAHGVRACPGMYTHTSTGLLLFVDKEHISSASKDTLRKLRAHGARYSRRRGAFILPTSAVSALDASGFVHVQRNDAHTQVPVEDAHVPVEDAHVPVEDAHVPV